MLTSDMCQNDIRPISRSFYTQSNGAAAGRDRRPPAETPTAEDLAAFEEADAEDPPDDRYAATGTVRDRQ